MGAGLIKVAFAIVNLEVIDYKITRLDKSFMQRTNSQSYNNINKCKNKTIFI